ncbi:MAG: DUF4339 domain-containing protein [Bacteroidetes bacterium]|uniref:DUF4339 domain-containing protein n=1 Tax=Candidatus Cryptobacteroides avicola TaxID=2840757 RepID=A0A940DQC0_9BACT|nr:DUF4339 domain-containing protein [Candidatus Cryptobacteroides avicola]
MDIDQMSEMAMGLAMYDTYKSSMEKNRNIAAGIEDKYTGKQPDHVYHAILNGQQRGPFSLGEMAAMIADGKIVPETYVWKQGMPDWLPARDVPGLVFKSEKKEEENGQSE